jgi:hypothetical protein
LKPAASLKKFMRSWPKAYPAHGGRNPYSRYL